MADAVVSETTGLDAAPTVTEGVTGRRRQRDWKVTALRTSSIVGALVIWQGLATSGVFGHLLLPGPIEVVKAGWQLTDHGPLLGDVGISLERVATGFFLAAVIAVPMGIASARSEVLFNLIDPLVEIARPIPVLALLPLAILWFGIGEQSKIFIIAYGTFFPIFINTVMGVRKIDPLLVRAAQTLGATRAQTFRRVVLMASVPEIFAGLRLGLGFSFLTLVAAELIAAHSGIGYLIEQTQLTFQTQDMMVGIALFGLLGFGSSWALLRVERRVLRWSPRHASKSRE